MPLRPPVSKPAPPRFAPYQPPVKRSPFERPKVFFSAPALVTPSRPPAARVRLRSRRRPSFLGSSKTKCRDGKARGLPLETRAAEPRQRSSLHDLLAVNPGILDANHIVAGSQIYLPAVVSSLRTATKITVRKGDTLSRIAQNQLGPRGLLVLHRSSESGRPRCKHHLRRPVLLLPGQLQSHRNFRLEDFTSSPAGVALSARYTGLSSTKMTPLPRRVHPDALSRWI